MVLLENGVCEGCICRECIYHTRQSCDSCRNCIDAEIKLECEEFEEDFGSVYYN